MQRIQMAHLRYPRITSDLSIDTIEVDLIDETRRLPRSIRITYDYDRDGYVVSAETGSGTWVEKGFVPAQEEG